MNITFIAIKRLYPVSGLVSWRTAVALFREGEETPSTVQTSQHSLRMRGESLGNSAETTRQLSQMTMRREQSSTRRVKAVVETMKRLSCEVKGQIGTDELSA